MRAFSRLHRPLAALSLGAMVLLPASPVGAYDMQGSSITMELELPDEDGEFQLTTNEEDIRDFFNLAHCVCGDTNFQMRVTLQNAPAGTLDPEPVGIFAGTNCLAPEIDVREMSCDAVDTIGDIEDLRNRLVDVQIPVHSLISPGQDICFFDQGEKNVYAIIDENNDGFGDGDYASDAFGIPFDSEPPPALENISGAGGENAVQLEWDLPFSRTEDVRYIQALCSRADGRLNPNDDFPRGEPRYLTSLQACGVDDGTVPTVVDVSRLVPAGGNDGGVGLPDAGGTPPPDGGVVDPDLPGTLRVLDPETVCGEAVGTETSLRIDGLENAVPYRIVLLSVDEHRNVTAMDLGVFTPQPVKDAWEHYQDLGGNADGGYCFVATATFGDYEHPFVRVLRTFRDDTLAHVGLGRAFIRWYYDNSPGLAGFIAEHELARAVSYLLLAPLVGAAFVWEFTGPFGKLALLLAFFLLRELRRRRKEHRALEPAAMQASPARRRLAVAAASVALTVGVSATAYAQPYWDELNEPVEVDPRTIKSDWNLEFKFGPYIPDIDAEFSGSGPGPYEQVFDDDQQLMTIISLDRFFTYPLGQLGVTGSIGYMATQAKAFQVDASGNILMDADGNPLRSGGDETSFNLIPVTLGGAYRFSYLDEEFGVPVVPYGKLALAYYLWRFTNPNGDTSESPTMDCPNAGQPDANCTGNLGRGGSLGFQANLGVAIRAERIDPDAERSLRNEMGIEHAGFFVELQLAQVDGFGADDKLSVGDSTWFGGINFEF